MKYLTCSTSDERNDVVNSWYTANRPSSVIAQLLQMVVAHEDDNEEDPDGYWHP